MQTHPHPTAPPTAPFDPDVARVLALMAANGRKPYPAQTVAEARAAYRAGCKLNGLPSVAMAQVLDLTATPPDMAPIPLRLYRPPGVAGHAAPAIVYFHGGGWVLGDLDTHDSICRHLATAGNCCVVAVDYRLAPEHPFPAAADDAVAAWRWIAGQAEPLGLDATRLAVAGDSAGGNLATVVALAQRGQAHAPTQQLLFYPVTDLAAESAGYARVTQGVPLVASTMRWFRDHYLPPGSGGDSRASPLRSTELTGLPPALIVTAAHDPLCEEGMAYGAALAAAGARTAQLHLTDQIHGFLTLGGLIGAASAVLAFAGAWASGQRRVV